MNRQSATGWRFFYVAVAMPLMMRLYWGGQLPVTN
jgi:hypothetical protein